MGTTLATARFAKNGYIAWKNALLCIVTALIGSSLGAKLALQLDDYYFKRLILVILPCTALYLTFGKPFVGEKESFPVRKMILFSALIAFIIGIYDALRSRNRNISAASPHWNCPHGTEGSQRDHKSHQPDNEPDSPGGLPHERKSNFPSWTHCRYLQHSPEIISEHAVSTRAAQSL